MDILLKAVAGVLLAVIASLILSRQGKDFSILLVISVCCMICSTAVAYYLQIFEFIGTLERIGNLNSELISIILKAVGIGILTEITVLICSDSGNAALGKVIQMLSSAVIIWLCIPLFTELLGLVEGILNYL